MGLERRFPPSRRCSAGGTASYGRDYRL